MTVTEATPQSPIIDSASASPTAAEPPRKRQRNGTQTLSTPHSRNMSRAPSPGASSSTTMSSLSLSTPSPAPFARQLSREGSVNDTLPNKGAGAGWRNASHTDGVRSESSAHVGSFPQTDQQEQGQDARGDQGGAFGMPMGLKGEWKGKARGYPPITIDSEGGDMVWETEGGAGSMPKTMATNSHGLGNGGPANEDVPVRDGEYYIDSADCVIRVDNTLFRVHRYFLGRDASAFQHMFTMPANGIPPERMEGYSDENPIRLYGESVERFRALLSVIYDLPLQLQAYNTPEGDADRLLTIAEMTNKYHFVSIETWAVNALYNVISGLHGAPQQRYELGHCSSSWMKRLLEIALVCGHTRLRDYVAERWVDRIVARDLRPVHALEISRRSSVRGLQGYAYYVQLLEMGDDFDPGVVEDGKQYSRSRLASQPFAAAAAGPSGAAPGSEGRNGTPAVLTRGEKQRLLSGHWSLTRLWGELRTNPPQFQRPDGCTYHQHGCLATWTTVWQEVGRTEATLKYAVVDVLGRLKAMEEQLIMHADLSCALTPQCKRAALLALKATVRDVQEGLADRFADLTAVRVWTDTEEMLMPR